MHTFNSTETTFAAPDSAASAAARSNALALSALQATREAIARWTGGSGRPAVMPRDVYRVSPQARWVDQAQRGLAAWKESGGFAQDESGRRTPAHAPVMYALPSALPDNTSAHAGACAD